MREVNRVRQDLEKKNLNLSSQIKAEFSRFSAETRTVLNTIDDKIETCVQEKVDLAFADLKSLINNLRIRVGS